eukprot:508997_1
MYLKQYDVQKDKNSVPTQTVPLFIASVGAKGVGLSEPAESKLLQWDHHQFEYVHENTTICLLIISIFTIICTFSIIMNYTFGSFIFFIIRICIYNIINICIFHQCYQQISYKQSILMNEHNHLLELYVSDII